MKTAIFITVRTGSTRLKNKALIEIQSIPTIVHLIRRMKKIDVDNIVLCTTILEEDDILCEIAKNEKIDFSAFCQFSLFFFGAHLRRADFPTFPFTFRLGTPPARQMSPFFPRARLRRAHFCLIFLCVP